MNIIVTCNKCHFVESESHFEFTDTISICPQCNGTELTRGLVDDQTMEVASHFSQVLLQRSILIEDARKRLREFTQALKTKDTALEVMAEYITESLEAFEEIFNTHDGAFPVEKMARYIVAAKYMEARYGRKNIVKQVEQKLRSLSI